MALGPVNAGTTDYNSLSGKPSSFTPSPHASTGTTYGKGDGTNYGHVKLSDSTNDTSGVSGGIAATPAAVKAAYDLALDKSRAATIVVAASDSSEQSKAAADYICTGEGDQMTIENAISALPSYGGKVLLMEGKYIAGGRLVINKSNVTLEGMGINATTIKRATTMVDSAIIIQAANVSVKNLTVDGNDAWAGIFTNGDPYDITRFCISDVRIINCDKGIEAFNNDNNERMGKGLIRSVLVENSTTGIGVNTKYNMVVDCRVINCNVGILVNFPYNEIHGNYVMRGTGQASDYTSAQHTIQVTGANNNISDNYIPGKNYTNSGGSTNTFDNNKYQ